MAEQSDQKSWGFLTSWIPRSPRRRMDLLTAAVFLAPSVTVFGIFIYYSLGFNIYLSFTDWNFLSKNKGFVGLENFEIMFGDYRFWKMFTNTWYYASGTVVMSLVIGLFLAILLNQAIPFRGFFRTVIFSPYVTTTSAIAVLWIWIFEPTYGLMNDGLRLFGIMGPRWLTDTDWAMPALLIMNAWRSSGYTMVIFLAGLTNIPREFYEAAQIDGAGPWSVFRNITIPLLSPTTFFLMVTSLISAFQVFDQVAVMTQGGPANSTVVFNYYIYAQAFQNFRAGYASAVAMLLFLILLTLTLIQLRLSRRWVHYQ